jgi:hypothetical protein
MKEPAPVKRLRRNADAEKDDEVIGKRPRSDVPSTIPVAEKRQAKDSESEKILTKEEIERKIAENKKKEEEEARKKGPIDAAKLALLKKFAAN